MRQYIGGVIAERNILSPFCLFVKTLPVNLAVASGNGNRFCTQKLHVQRQIVMDYHSPRLIPNYCHLSDPPHFSLLSTFKGRGPTIFLIRGIMTKKLGYLYLRDELSEDLFKQGFNLGIFHCSMSFHIFTTFLSLFVLLLRLFTPPALLI